MNKNGVLNRCLSLHLYTKMLPICIDFGLSSKKVSPCCHQLPLLQEAGFCKLVRGNKFRRRLDERLGLPQEPLDKNEMLLLVVLSGVRLLQQLDIKKKN